MMMMMSWFYSGASNAQTLKTAIKPLSVEEGGEKNPDENAREKPPTIGRAPTHLTLWNTSKLRLENVHKHRDLTPCSERVDDQMLGVYPSELPRPIFKMGIGAWINIINA